MSLLRTAFMWIPLFLLDNIQFKNKFRVMTQSIWQENLWNKISKKTIFKIVGKKLIHYQTKSVSYCVIKYVLRTVLSVKSTVFLDNIHFRSKWVTDLKLHAEKLYISSTVMTLYPGSYSWPKKVYTLKPYLAIFSLLY